ncbi:MAG TPA: glycosyltransferase [Polyangiaceae bacterium]|jgi:spore maturation protein CgeB|nr:glycosyltransferase [Polyangiaceae bacterium]
MQLKFVFLGLSITSSWGNGHATTYRGLIRELARRGHEVLFLEHDVPYYAMNRDLPQPPFCRTELYANLDDLFERFAGEVRAADVVVVGSYVPEGVRVGAWVCRVATGLRAFYDIDTPITLRGLDSGGMPYLLAAQVSEYDLYLSFSGGPSLARLTRDFGARAVRALYCSVDPEHYYPERTTPSWDLGYLGTFSADRQAALDHLLLEPAHCWSAGRFVVAGPQYPMELEWPANVSRLSHVAPPDHRAFYNAQRFTLNLTRRDMLVAGYSPSVRLFEAAAAGAPILTDIWPGLEQFFEPEREIALVRDSRDVLEWLQRRSEEARLSLAEAGRRRVLSEHTAAHRAEALDSYASELLAARARARRRPKGEGQALHTGGES